MRQNLYKIVTDELLLSMEDADSIPWRRAWKGSFVPRNGSNGRPYRGINVPYLWAVAINRDYDSNEWFTYNGAHTSGGHVKRGERCHAHAVYWKIIEDKNDKSKSYPLIRSYAVFNANQCENLEQIPALTPEGRSQAEDRAMDCIDKLGVRSREGEPAYLLNEDIIEMPRAEAFERPADYLGTFFHEICHWTGHKDRLNRNFNHRADEELIAELGSCYLAGYFEILDCEAQTQSAVYLKSWVDSMKEDNRYIFKAARDGFAAANYVLGEPDELKAVEEPETVMTFTRE